MFGTIVRNVEYIAPKRLVQIVLNVEFICVFLAFAPRLYYQVECTKSEGRWCEFSGGQETDFECGQALRLETRLGKSSLPFSVHQGGASAEGPGVSECTWCNESEGLHGTYQSLAHRCGKGAARV